MQSGSDQTEGIKTIVRSLPTRWAGQTTDLPYLFIETPAKEAELHLEALEYARASYAVNKILVIQNDVETLARFLEFTDVFWGRKEVPDEALEYLIYAFLIWRNNGTLKQGGSTLGGLRWSSLGSEALRREFNSLIRYAAFAKQRWGQISLVRSQAKVNISQSFVADMKRLEERKNRDFLIHLNASREHWARQYGSDIEMPFVASSKQRRSSTRHVMPETEVWAIIEAEKNPTFRALWLTGAFGGIRISEQLNLWQIDVLPSSLRNLAFGYDGGDNVMVLRADPVSSRYTGDLSKAGAKRQDVLASKYGMQPRNKLRGCLETPSI